MISVEKKKPALVQIRRPFGEDRMLRGLSQRVGLGGRVATEQFHEEMAMKQIYIYIHIHIHIHIILYYIIYIYYYILYIYIIIYIYYIYIIIYIIYIYIWIIDG